MRRVRSAHIASVDATQAAKGCVICVVGMCGVEDRGGNVGPQLVDVEAVTDQ